MKKVKITGTTYGYHNNGRIEPKDRKSPPFMLDDAEAERLVELGVAEIVGEGVAMPVNDEKQVDASENTPEAEDRAEDAEIAQKGEGDIPYTERPDYDESTKVNDLREIAKKVGIKFSVGMKKEDMIAQLDEFFDDYFSEVDLAAAEPLA